MVNTELADLSGIGSINYNILNIVVNTERNKLPMIIVNYYNILNIVVNTEPII